MSFKVSFAIRADIPAILACANWAAEHTPANFATSPETVEEWSAAFEATRAMYPWLVARADDKVIGFAKAGPHKARGAYRFTADVSVYVDPTWHGRGVGKALYARLIPMLRAQGYVTLIAGITPPNPASERLHESVGFKRCGTFHRAGWKFGRWHDVGYWEMQLNEGAPQEAVPVAKLPTLSL
jgi:phosphinothricin acetyltransferase